MCEAWVSLRAAVPALASFLGAGRLCFSVHSVQGPWRCVGSSTPAPQALGRGKGEAKGILQQLAHFQKLNTVNAFIGNKICFVDNDLKPCIFFQDFSVGYHFDFL